LTGARIAAGVFVGLGLAATSLALGSFVDGRSKRFYQQLWARGTWNRGPSATFALAPIGVGISLLGLAILTGVEALIVASFVAMVLGGLIYVTDPRWLRPRWTRRK
jgi:hypothetical protein